MCNPARQEDVNDRLGGPFEVLVILELGAGRLGAQQLRQRQSGCTSESTNRQEAAAIEPSKVVWITILLHDDNSTRNGLRTEERTAKSVIHIFLPGGIAHQESFDPKPNAPIEYRGEMKQK
eukprot:TRINITY_DN71990_c0_g1_i3.p1 TRINITY_DN71990_c0_g1~~TRINITY_DN71990_c0_g1_i3.p1  ORF type:complete len:121 (+),score=5.81 TRINITY_DN71990_c0_g1_i3:83-445(+)